MNIFRSFIDILLEALFPRTDTEEKLKNLTFEQFMAKTKKSADLPYRNMQAILSYQDPLVKELVWSIKYKKDFHAVEIAGRVLFEALNKKRENCATPILLVPIPISEQRRRERGYNQCELFAHEIVKIDGGGAFKLNSDLLFRKLHKNRQTLKNRQERIDGARDIFGIRENGISKEQCIVVIDDVITTGSTMNSALLTLTAAGFVNVQGLSIAH